MATRSWDIYRALDIDRSSLFHCIGTATTYNRRCRINLDGNSQRAAMASLRRINLHAPKYNDSRLKYDLLEVASHLLCTKYHQNQATVIVEDWLDSIEDWVGQERLVCQSTSVTQSTVTSTTNSTPQSPELAQPSYTVLHVEQQTSNLRSSRRQEQPPTRVQNPPELHGNSVSGAATNPSSQPVTASPSQKSPASPPSRAPGLESVPTFRSTFDFGAAVSNVRSPFSASQPAPFAASRHYSTSTIKSSQGDIVSTERASYTGAVALPPSELPADPIPVATRREKVVAEQAPLSTFDVDALIASEIGTGSSRSVSREIPQDTFETVPGQYDEDPPSNATRDQRPSPEARPQPRAHQRRGPANRTARMLTRLREMRIK